MKKFISVLLYPVIAMLLMLGASTAWGASEEYVCDPSKDVGVWKITEWTNFPASGCPVYDYYYGREEFVRSSITVGGINTYLYAKVYCDTYSGPNFEGKVPWAWVDH